MKVSYQPLPSHAKTKTSCTHTHEKSVLNHVLRVSGDCCDTDAGFSKSWRLVQLKDTVTEMRSLHNLLQAPARISPSQHLPSETPTNGIGCIA
jgi:hypothetical protein